MDDDLSTVYTRPGEGSPSDFLKYEYDETAGRVRKVSSVRQRIFGFKKNRVYGGFVVMVLAAAFVGAFLVLKPASKITAPSASLATLHQFCRTDQNCNGNLECFVNQDIVEDETSKANFMRGTCLEPTGEMKHCTSGGECPENYECRAQMESFRGECRLKVGVTERAEPLPTDQIVRLSDSSTRAARRQRRLQSVGGREMRSCCMAYKATCLACTRGVGVEEYCRTEAHGHVPGCPEHSHGHEEGHGHHEHEHKEPPRPAKGNTKKPHVNGFIEKQVKLWKDGGRMHPFDTFGDSDEGAGTCLEQREKVLFENGKRVKRRLSTSSSCSQHACDWPENRDKFANVDVPRTLPVEFIVVTDADGNLPGRRTGKDFDDAMSTLNQAYEQVGISFSGTLRTIKSDDLFMMSVSPDPSHKGRLEGYMEQMVRVDKGQTSRNVYPVKPLRFLKGEYDWQFLRKGDMIALHRQRERHFDEIESQMQREGIPITRAERKTDAQPSDGAKGRKLFWDHKAVAKTRRGGRGRSRRGGRRYGRSRVGRPGRHHRRYRKELVSAYRRKAERLHSSKMRLVNMYLKLFIANKKAEELSGENRCKKEAEAKFLEKMAAPEIAKTSAECKSAIFSKCCKECSLDENESGENWDACWYTCYEDSAVDFQGVCKKKEESKLTEGFVFARPSPKLRVDFMQCSTCNNATLPSGLKICPFVENGDEMSCTSIGHKLTTTKALETDSVIFAPTSPGWYYLKVSAVDGPLEEGFNMLLEANMGGSAISDEAMMSRMGTRSKDKMSAFQIYAFNMAVDGLLGWAYPPAWTEPINQGVVVMNNYRIALGSSTFPHELGHTLGLYHTFQGTHGMGQYDEHGDVVFRGETDAQKKKRKEVAFGKLLAAEKVKLRKTQKDAAEEEKKKLEFSEHPLIMADQGSCPICVESPDSSDDHRDRVGDFCSDTRPIPKQHLCGNPDVSKTPPICGSQSWKETPYSNLMSYGKDFCRKDLTAQQASRVKCYLYSTGKLASIAGVVAIEDVDAWTAPKDSNIQRDVLQEPLAKRKDIIVDDIDTMGDPTEP